jgi:response regulator RpfG family c-di-GMP phosphodiesterase
MTRDDVIQYLRDHSGSHFDPNLAERFIRMMLADG